MVIYFRLIKWCNWTHGFQLSKIFHEIMNVDPYSFLLVLSHLLQKSLIENFIFSAVLPCRLPLAKLWFYSTSFCIFCLISSLFLVESRLFSVPKIFKRKNLFEEFHIWHRHLTVQVKHSYILSSLCLLYFTGNKCLKFP